MLAERKSDVNHILEGGSPRVGCSKKRTLVRNMQPNMDKQQEILVLINHKNSKDTGQNGKRRFKESVSPTQVASKKEVFSSTGLIVPGPRHSKKSQQYREERTNQARITKKIA